MELAVSKIGQKVCHCFVLRYKNIKIVNSVQVQVARTCEGVNILSNVTWMEREMDKQTDEMTKESSRGSLCGQKQPGNAVFAHA